MSAIVIMQMISYVFSYFEYANDYRAMLAQSAVMRQ